VRWEKLKQIEYNRFLRDVYSAEKNIVVDPEAKDVAMDPIFRKVNPPIEPDEMRH
jgi:hypothetical protein